MNVQAEAIRLVTAEYLSTKPIAQPCQYLLQSLHCPYMDVDLDLCFDREALDPEVLSQLRESLLALLRVPLRANGWSMANAALLAGVSHYVPREIFTENEEDAYNVAATLIYFLDDHLPRAPLIKSHATALLNDWLRPGTPWESLPDVVTACRHMFGDAWCEFRLAGVIVGRSGRIIQTNGPIDISKVVETERPAFLRGLCRKQDVSHEVALPDMGLSLGA